MKQKGFAFLPFLLANWQLIAIVLLALSAFAYFKHCQNVELAHTQLIASLKAAAIENEKKVKQAIDLARKDKERADESHKRTVARLNRDIKRLRDNPPSSFLPPAAPGSASPDRACFSRADIERTLRDYRTEILGLVEAGDSAIAGLNTAKDWAQR